MTGDLTVPSLNGGQLAGFRNQIINGGMDVWQRSTSFTNTTLGYRTVDRWYIETNGLNTVSERFLISETTNNLKNEAPTTYGMKLHANGAPLEVRQCIELKSTGQAQEFLPGTKWFISWYSDLRDGSIDKDGTFINCRAAFMDNASDPGSNTEIIGALVNLGGRRWGFPITIQSTPPPTATCLRIDLITGNVGNFQFTAVQLEPGPVATPFEHRPIGTELALCQRYYQYLDEVSCPVVRGANTDQRNTVFARSVEMRVDPTETATEANNTNTPAAYGNAKAWQVAGAPRDGGVIVLVNVTADAEL
jgi:hypothetical protein